MDNEGQTHLAMPLEGTLMARLMPRAKRMEAALEAARVMYEALEEWYDAHPDASHEEIEEEARRLRREMMGDVLETLINGRDTGIQLDLPRCAQCGREMRFEGYNAWEVHGVEGDSTFERAYYLCPECKEQGFFPPRPQAAAAS
jgi:hypothetical protein